MVAAGTGVVRVAGRGAVWEPTPRLVFTFGPPDDARTEVEVRFEATENGTRVVLRHRGWTDTATGPWAAVLAGFARHPLERALLHRLGEFLDAIGVGDVGFFERNLTDDALLIFPGRDNTDTKASDHPPYVKYDVEQPRTVMVSSVLTKVEGSWRLAMHQWTQIDG